MSLAVGDTTIALEMTVPAGACDSEALLPIAHGLSDLFAARGIARAQAAGRTLSCRAGCGACCRQMVPIAEAEAVALARLVEAMPEPRRSRIRNRFETGLNTLDSHGLVDRILGPGVTSDPTIASDYLRLGIACPFLEAEACSIYPDRPMICREFLVTSPPENCRAPSPETIEPVALEREPSHAWQLAESERGWTMLILALRVAAAAPPVTTKRTGPEILRGLIDAMRD